MRIYLATSWRNKRIDETLNHLTYAGHSAYDFRTNGFSWNAIDPNFKDWSTERMISELVGDKATEAFEMDLEKLNDCDVLVIQAPFGQSAMFELGYAAAHKKTTIALLNDVDGRQPAELMLKMCDFFVYSIDDLVMVLSSLDNEYKKDPRKG